MREAFSCYYKYEENIPTKENTMKTMNEEKTKSCNA